MKIAMTNRADRNISQTYEIVRNCSVQMYADLNFKPHWVLELPSKPDDLFPTASFPCTDWDIDVTE